MLHMRHIAGGPVLVRSSGLESPLAIAVAPRQQSMKPVLSAAISLMIEPMMHAVCEDAAKLLSAQRSAATSFRSSWRTSAKDGLSEESADLQHGQGPFQQTERYTGSLTETAAMQDPAFPKVSHNRQESLAGMQCPVDHPGFAAQQDKG